MFESIAHRPRDASLGRRILTTSLSVGAHFSVLGMLVVLPLWYFTPAAPAPAEILAFVAPPPSAPPPPPPAPVQHAKPRSRTAPRPVPPRVPEAAAPLQAPAHIEPEPAVETPATEVFPGGVEGGVPGGVIGGIVSSARLPPPPPPPLEPVRIGGQIKAPALITRVEPEYPAIAQAAHIEGIVILEATVSETGRVKSVKVLRSAGLLDPAAVKAVKQWQYSPLTLNGRATPFVLTVTLQFHIDDRDS